MNRAPHQDLPIFVHWMSFLEWLLDATSKFPKSARFTFASRIDNLALDIVERLVEARYAKSKRAVLRQADLALEKIRVLLRICHNRRYLSTQGYEYASRELAEAGRMLGGWMKQQEKP